MKILGIDLGTTTGWGLLENERRITSGIIRLKANNEDRISRLIKAKEHFDNLIETYNPDLVSYEMVRRWASSDAAFMYNALLGQLLISCKTHQQKSIGYSPTTIKKLATGSGRADKKAMIEKTKEVFKHIPVTDDEADALWIAMAGFSA